MSFSPEDLDRAKSWPFQEARALAKHVAQKPTDEPIIFQTGYGPSGLPHIGTFGEVARTSMVRHAFSLLTGRKSRLFCFSDDMDGLRKVPDNVPNQELLTQNDPAEFAHLGSDVVSQIEESRRNIEHSYQLLAENA